MLQNIGGGSVWGLLSGCGLADGPGKGRLHFAWFRMGLLTGLEFLNLIKCLLCAIYCFKCFRNIKSFNSVLTTTVTGRYLYHPPLSFTDEETEAQRG